MSGVGKTIGKAELRRFRPYPAYKDSGVEWLGKIPVHWEVKRLKSIASIQLSNVDKKSVEGEQPVRLCNYVDVYYHERITANLDFMTATATPEQMRRFSLHAGDVLITKDSESWTDIAVPALVAEDLPGVLCGYHLALIRPGLGCHGPFLARTFSAIGPRDQFQISANGITRFGLGDDAIRTGLFPMPPEPEQRTIATYLDRETAKIDAMVTKKERLIALLQEKRTALITRAVTKGLDPSLPMKDSGVEWLGEIPAHWELQPVWTLFSLGRGRVISHEEIHENPGPYPVYSSQTENDGVMGHMATYDFFGDFLTWTTDGANAGTVFSRSGKFNCTNVCGTLQARQPSHVELRFVRDALNIATGWFVRHDINPKLMNNVMARIRVQMPPRTEQAAIVAFLDKETEKIDTLAQRIIRAIKQLRDFRTTLISAAVTGKIDVREVA